MTAYRALPSHLFQCDEGDYEGSLSGAIHHCDITGHTLRKTNTRGNVVVVEMDHHDRSVFIEDLE